MSTLAEEWEEHRAARKNLVTYNEKTKCIDIDTEIDGYVYDIEISEIDSYESAVKWVYHLCEKKWMSPRKVKFFIETIWEINDC